MMSFAIVCFSLISVKDIPHRSIDGGKRTANKANHKYIKTSHCYSSLLFVSFGSHAFLNHKSQLASTPIAAARTYLGRIISTQSAAAIFSRCHRSRSSLLPKLRQIQGVRLVLSTPGHNSAFDCGGTRYGA